MALDGNRWGRIVAGSLVDGMRREIETTGWAASRVVAAAVEETTVAAWLERGSCEDEGLADVLLLAAALGSDRIAHAGLGRTDGAADLLLRGADGRGAGEGTVLAVDVVEGVGGAVRRRAWRHPVEAAGGMPRLRPGREVLDGRGHVAARLAAAVRLAAALSLAGDLEDVPNVAALLARCCARGHDLLVTVPMAARLLVEAGPEP